jgi:DNA-binding NarL/FixJ family response regulator
MTSRTGQTDGPILVFLLDDHEVVRQGVRRILEADGAVRVVGESGSAAAAIRRIPALRPDVALLDIRLPDGSGIDVARALRSAAPSVRTVMFTAYGDDKLLFDAIGAGSVGYLLKSVRCNYLTEALERVAGGQSVIDPALTSRVLDRIRRGPARAPQLAGLTEQELSLLKLIADGRTNREIALQMHLAEKTVKNYVSVLFHKLGVERRTQAAVLGSRLLA